MAMTVRITPLQAALMSINLIFPTAILFLPNIVAVTAKQDLWLSGLLATAVGLVGTWISTTLALYYPRRGVVAILHETLGVFVGRVVGWLVCVYLILETAIVVREFLEFEILSMLPKTPPVVIEVSVLICALYAVGQGGLEIVARMVPLAFLLMLVTMAVLVGLVAPQMDFQRLLPVAAHGWMPIVQGAIPPAQWMTETVMALILWLPYCNDPPRGRKLILWANLVTGTLMTLVGIVNVSVFGASLVANMTLPTYSLAQTINIADFLTNMDPFFVFVWTISNFLKITQFYLAAALVLAQLLELRSPRDIALSLGALIAFLAMYLFVDLTHLVFFLTKIWPPVTIGLFQVTLPLFLLVMTWSRHRRAMVAKENSWQTGGPSR